MTSNAVFGQPTPRVDGRAKVTGAAKYGADHAPPAALHAFLATSAIARGRIVSIASERVRAMPGVLLVLTHENVGGRIHEVNSVAQSGPMSFGKSPLGSPEVYFAGQIVALVVAETMEAARNAARSLRVEYEVDASTASMDDPGSAVVEASSQSEIALLHGDPETAWRDAAVQIYQRYETPIQHHNPLELFQTTCAWEGGRLTVWESSQNTRGYRSGLASQLGVPVERVRVLSPFVGGAFGSRGPLAHYTALVALAARELGRPVKLVASRQQGFTLRTFRAETRHDVHLACDREGRLAALMHESWELTSRVDVFALAGSESTSRLYACPNIRTQVHNVVADRQMPGYMRAPPELPYLFALESAMDELAHELGMDPIELRRRNETRVDPIHGAPYSSRSLLQCYDAAAPAFGWERRRQQPGTITDGDWLVGFGCASALYPANIGSAECRVTLMEGGRARVEIGTQEIGNGAYTIIAQTAAERLGLRVEDIEVRLGDSDLPAAPITAGSNSAASTCNAVAHTCEELQRRRAAEPGTPLPFTVETANRPEVVPAPDGGLDKIRRGMAVIAGGVTREYLAFAFGAQFAEARVHRVTGEIRVPRLVGAFACGRIVNPLTARSQLMSGQIWGMSSALLEATEIDRRRARYVNVDLAEYHVPVNADVAEVTTLLIPEEDSRINPLGIKGVGEIGATGVNAAIVNAVFNACGVRIRELPLRLDQLLGRGALA